MVNLSRGAWNANVTGTAEHPVTGKRVDFASSQGVSGSSVQNGVPLALAPYGSVGPSLQ